MSLQPGSRVTAAYRGSHTGVVLDRGDPHAWTDTLAFPGRVPTAEEVRTHLADCASRGIVLTARVPIRWCFGMTDWERIELLGAALGAPCGCLHGIWAS